MLTPSRALALNAEAGRELPRIPCIRGALQGGIRPRHGEVVMIAGRSGTQKSGVALFWCAQMNLRTLYFSADMSAFTASARLASMYSGDPTDVVEAGMAAGGDARQKYLDLLKDSNITFVRPPLRWEKVDYELEAYVELWEPLA